MSNLISSILLNLDLSYNYFKNKTYTRKFTAQIPLKQIPSSPFPLHKHINTETKIPCINLPWQTSEYHPQIYIQGFSWKWMQQKNYRLTYKKFILTSMAGAPAKKKYYCISIWRVAFIPRPFDSTLRIWNINMKMAFVPRPFNSTLRIWMWQDKYNPLMPNNREGGVTNKIMQGSPSKQSFPYVPECVRKKQDS
jgi:hypothetical protein